MDNREIEKNEPSSDTIEEETMDDFDYEDVYEITNEDTLAAIRESEQIALHPEK